MLVTNWSKMSPFVGLVIKELPKLPFPGGGRGAWIAKSIRERSDVEGKTERKSKLVIKETSGNSILKECKAKSYLLICHMFCWPRLISFIPFRMCFVLLAKAAL